MKERQLQAREEVNNIYETLKSDLKLCIKYHRRNKSEKVKEYFGTDNWEEIEKQLQVICKPFSLIQKIQISRWISELHNFYIQPTTEGEKKSKRKSKS